MAVEDVFSVGYAYFVVPASITFTVIVFVVCVAVAAFGWKSHVAVVLVTLVDVHELICLPLSYQV